MREILFRGKRIDNGEWVYGDLLTQRYFENRYFILPEWGEDEMYLFEVDYETVGQYTGLTDKNGTKIFEGDVVKFTDKLDGELIGEIFYDSEMLDWRVYVPILRTVYFLANSRKGKCEVIGNKWDNADLLEGKNG